MKTYKVELYITAEDGLTEGDLWYRMYGATKHSELHWSIGELLGVEDANEEDL